MATVARPLQLACHAAQVPASAADGTPPARVQLLPAGTFGGADGRGPWIVRDGAAVVAASLAKAATTSGQIPIDFDHASFLDADTAPAAGWITGLEIDSDGCLCGDVEWTPRGAQAIASKEYRFLSPVFDFVAGSFPGEVVCLRGAGLTNRPNLRLTALSAQDARLSPSSDPSMTPEQLAALRAALGLAADASTETVLNAARTAQARAQAPDPAQYVPVAVHTAVVTELNTMKLETRKAEAARQVEAAITAGKITPGQREWATAYCTQNPEGFAQFVGAQPTIVAAGASAADAGKDGADAAARDNVTALNADERRIAELLGQDPAKVLAQKQRDAAAPSTSRTE
jgi:phage I-like protein